MEEYVKLYEDFNPREQKKEIAERVKSIKDRINRREDSLKRAKEKGHELSAEILNKRIAVDNYSLEQQKLKSEIIDLRSQKRR